MGVLAGCCTHRIFLLLCLVMPDQLCVNRHFGVITSLSIVSLILFCCNFLPIVCLTIGVVWCLPLSIVQQFKQWELLQKCNVSCVSPNFHCTNKFVFFLLEKVAVVTEKKGSLIEEFLWFLLFFWFPPIYAEISLKVQMSRWTFCWLKILVWRVIHVLRFPTAQTTRRRS